MPYTNLNLASLRVYVRNRIQNTSFFSDAEILDAINEAIRIFQLGTGFWRARYVLTTTAARVFYDLTAEPQLQVGGVPQILMPLRMAFNGQPMDFCSLWDMDCGLPKWQMAKTGDVGVPPTPIIWGTVGCNMAYIWPRDSAGNNSLVIDAVTRTPVLVNGGDFLNIDSSAIPQLLDGIEHTLQFKRGGAIWQSTFPKLRSFMELVASRNASLRASAPFRQLLGEQANRRKRPRKAQDFTGWKVGIGVR